MRQPAYTVTNWRYWANVTCTHFSGGEKSLMDLYDEGWFSRANVLNILFGGIKTWRKHTKPVRESLLEATRAHKYVHMTNQEILDRDFHWSLIYPSMKGDVVEAREDKEEYTELGRLQKFEKSEEDDEF